MYRLAPVAPPRARILSEKRGVGGGSVFQTLAFSLALALSRTLRIAICLAAGAFRRSRFRSFGLELPVKLSLADLKETKGEKEAQSRAPRGSRRARRQKGECRRLRLSPTPLELDSKLCSLRSPNSRHARHLLHPQYYGSAVFVRRKGEGRRKRRVRLRSRARTGACSSTVLRCFEGSRALQPFFFRPRALR